MDCSLLLFVLAALSAVGLFALPARAGEPARESDADFPVGMWVWVSKVFPAEPEARAQYVDKVLGNIAALGCDVVCIGAGASDERLSLMDRAHEAGLRVIISCGNVHTWVRTGLLDGVPADVADVVDPAVERFSKHPALHMYFINDIPGPDHVERLAQATARFRALDPAHPTYVPYNYMVVPYWQRARTPAVTWDNFPVVHAAPPGRLVNDSWNVGSPQAQGLREIAAGTPGARHITLVQCWGYDPDQGRRQRPPTLADLRQQTFLAMANGWTDGLVFYHYHSRVQTEGKGGTRFSVYNLDGSLRIGPEADLKAFIAKTRAMGRVLAGSSVEEVRKIRPEWPLQVALFSRRDREFLMFLSNDVQEKHSQDVGVSLINTREVAALVDVLEGTRHERGDAEGITLPLTLAPGDAALYEVEYADR